MGFRVQPEANGTAIRVMSVAPREGSMLTAFSLKSNILLPPAEFVRMMRLTQAVDHTDIYTPHSTTR